ncbi:cellulosome protein [Streptomyces sp. NPDC090106]|uniref:cellulosome protein n=1 Tax=Streptomyces sp. NPDC090106 TaxID=3365946 RepID=UPI00380A7D73
MAAETLTVDLGTGTGPFHGGASGTLYGLYGDGVPTRTAVEGMYVRTVATKAQDGVQHPGGDALEVLPAFVAAGGRDLYLYMPDILRGFPYEWPGATGEERLARYRENIRRQVEQVVRAGEPASHVVYVPFNEPEGNMFGEGEWSHDRVSWRTDPERYFAAWRDIHRLIKDLHPGARVAGPNTCLLYPEVKGFLAFAKEHGVLPDVITWHELSSPAEVRTSVARYRSWERELGIGPLPVNVNEYAHNYHLSVPGQMIQWIAAIEESKIDADMAYWNIAGNLNDSVVEANKANGQWWLFNAYGRLTGDTVEVTAPHPNVQYTLQGVAALDRDKRQARVLFGGSGGEAEVAVRGVDPGLFGTTVHARVVEIPWTGQVGSCAGPFVVRDGELPVVDGEVTVPLAGLDAMSAYQLTLSPRGAPTAPTAGWRRSYAAEDAAWTGTGRTLNGPEGSPEHVDRFASYGGRHVGGLRTGSDLVLAFDVEVPEDGTYDLRVHATSHNQADGVREHGPANVFLRVDGEDPRELRLPLGYKWAVWGHTGTRVRLAAGPHRVTLAAHDPLLGATRGDAVVDRIELALREPESTAAYDAVHAALGGAARVRDDAVSLPQGSTVTFWVHAEDDGETTTTLHGTGQGGLTVNGEPIDAVVGEDLALFLAAGVNKVTVTATSPELVVRKLTVGPSRGLLPSTTHAAEDGVLTGTATVAAFSSATGGKAVDGVGHGPANALTLTVTADRTGRHALTIRYSNGEQPPGTHYNPDPVCRHADLTVNGSDAGRVLFPTTFHFDNFWRLAVPVTLREGVNTLTFTSDALPDVDGTTGNTHGRRSAYAPVLDSVTVTPLAGRRAVS